MQLKTFKRGLVVGTMLVLAGTGAASAQSLSPMHKTGDTPSDTKGFHLTVGNPYKERMTFVAMPMDPKFVTDAEHAAVSPAEFRLAPGASRVVTVLFKIDPNAKERTIGLCILPKDLDGPLQPRVCGTYTGVKSAGTGG